MQWQMADFTVATILSTISLGTWILCGNGGEGDAHALTVSHNPSLELTPSINPLACWNPILACDVFRYERGYMV